MQIKPEDWISFLNPGLDKVKLKDMPSEFVPKIKSQMDNVKNVNDSFISHIEPNGYLDYAILGRMLRYRADIMEYMLYKNKEMTPISQALILFFEKHDNKLHDINEDLFEGQKLEYRYKIVKVWEIDPKEILSRKLYGLYPLLPIMKHDKNEDIEKIISDGINAIREVENAPLQADLMSVMSILASEKYSKELIKKYIRKEQLMDSALFNEWVEEFVIEGEKRGEKRGGEKCQMEIAKKLTLKGMSFDEIIEITGLPAAKVKNIMV